MSYTASVFNVMIASPGDVASERSIVRDVVYEWNAVHSMTRRIVLLPIGWETHSSPEMGDTAQSIINKQVLEKCDLLVGVFWTRIGTPTEHYSSGTVEEIEKHVDTGRPTMLYFSGQPVAMDMVDLQQVAVLKEFKRSCQDRGLYNSYDSHSDFKAKFYHHLQLKLNEHPLFQTEQTVDSSATVQSIMPLPELGLEARILLKEASIDPNGVILHIGFLSGTAIQANGKNLIQSSDRREIAKWEHALSELISNKLVVSRGHKNEVFDITNFGYQVADMIEL